MADPPRPECTIGEYGNRNRSRARLVIRNPPITVNKFEVSPALYRELKEIHFSSKRNEDVNRYLTNFFELCETVKVDGCSEEGKMLRLFSFSLKDDAKEWLNSFYVSSTTTWDDLEDKFQNNTFPQLCFLERGKRFPVTNRKKENLFVTLTRGSRVY
ncbi:uncharacterized protein [Cicer arietinum]|uniref:uncharacterized protein n=1 Tax=Cicer arietinum TaxID=3827 RepID=UPI003CC6AC76